MKTIKRMAVSVMAFVMIVSMFSCVAFTASATSDANWNLTFTNENGETVTSVEAGETFYISVGLKDYSTIGEMTLVTDEYDAPDDAASSYNNVITAVTAKLNIPELVTVDTTAITTPYATATTEKSFIDGVLTVIVWSDKASAGFDYAIGADELAANGGELFKIKAVAGETLGTASFTFNEGTASSKASVATLNKEADVAPSANQVAALAMGGYDTIYNMAVEAEDDGYRADLEIARKNVTFASDYSVLFAITQEVKAAYSKVYIVAEREQFDGDTAIESSSVTLTECSLNGSYYAFTYENFAAREIASGINATLYAEDAEGNVYYGPTISYSLRQYAENQIRKATVAEEFKTMMVDFLNYGAAAQTYFGYNTSDLANSGLTEDELALASPERDYVDSKSATVDSTKAVNITNFSLLFVDKITILAATDMDAATYEANKDNWVAQVSYTNFDGIDVTEEIALNDESLFNLNGTRYVLNFAGLKSREMDKVVTIKICDKEGNVVSNTVTYSVESYAYSKGTGETTLAKLVRNLIKFGDSNIAYFSER